MVIFKKTSILAVSQLLNPQVLEAAVTVAVEQGARGAGTLVEGLGGRLAGDSVKRLAEAIQGHLTDHSGRLTDALALANERAWKTIEIAIGGAGVWDRLASAEDKALRAEMQRFLSASIAADDPGFLARCLQELREARSKGLLGGQGRAGATAVGDELGPFARFDAPEALLTAECRVVEEVAAEFSRLGYEHLGRLLAVTPTRGQPLLATAVQYYFRRAIGQDEVLSRELSWARFGAIDRRLEDGFGLLASWQERHAQALEETLDGLARVESVATQTRDDVLTLIEDVRALADQHQLLRRQLIASDCVSYRDEQEREILRAVQRRFRALSDDQRARFPALGLDVARLEVVAGDFEGALDTSRDAATHLENARERAEAHHAAYHAALELNRWDEALAELREAARLDARFALWPVKYEPERILGAGAFGVAFLCHHRYKNRRVVLKTFDPGGVDREVATIFHEAQTIDHLNHPGIVRVFDCGFVDEAGQGRPYLELEWVPDSLSMEEYLRRHGPLTPDDLLPVATQVAQALREAHLAGILHRDVKPANLLVHRAEAGWRVKVIDFGLALRRGLARAGQAPSVARGHSIIGSAIAGTLNYAPPEQLDPGRSLDVGPHSDVFAFGRTCLFALFGTTQPRSRQIRELPDPWPDLLDDCCDVEIGSRPADFSAVLDRLKALPGLGRGAVIASGPHPRAAGERIVLEVEGQEVALRWCPPGRFRMGSPEDEADREPDEAQVDVTLSRGFWMQETPVTQGLWLAVMGSNPSEIQGSADLPVENVSWFEATRFGEALTGRLRGSRQLPSGWEIRLPTEAEWEYGCRAGTSTATVFGDRLGSHQANFDGDLPYNGGDEGPDRNSTSPVRSYAPNAWGLYDMHGNVLEWCRDGYDASLPGGVDPIGPEHAPRRVQRGGCWFASGKLCRSACRVHSLPDRQMSLYGLRVVGVSVS